MVCLVATHTLKAAGAQQSSSVAGQLGDMDSSGTVDHSDIDPFVGLLVPAQAVPEPVTLSLLALGACLPLLRKKRT